VCCASPQPQPRREEDFPGGPADGGSLGVIGGDGVGTGVGSGDGAGVGEGPVDGVGVSVGAGA
jgi:hypothetical protein